MRIWAGMLLLAAITMTSSAAAEPTVKVEPKPGSREEAEAIPYGVVPMGMFAAFVKNWGGDQPLQAVVRTPEEWNELFSPAVTMGNEKPTGPKPEFFNNGLLLVVARVMPAPADDETPLTVESLRKKGGETVLAYRYAPPADPGSYMVKNVLLVAVSKEHDGSFRFVEKGGQSR